MKTHSWNIDRIMKITDRTAVNKLVNGIGGNGTYESMLILRQTTQQLEALLKNINPSQYNERYRIIELQRTHIRQELDTIYALLESNSAIFETYNNELKKSRQLSSEDNEQKEQDVQNHYRYIKSLPETIRNDLPIEELQLPSRLYTIFRRNNIHSLKHLLTTPIEQLRSLKNFGKNCEDELYTTLAQMIPEQEKESYILFNPKDQEQIAQDMQNHYRYIKSLPEAIRNDLDLRELQLPAQLHNALKRGGIFSIGDLIITPLVDFRGIRGFGRKMEEEIYKILKQIVPNDK